MCFPPSKPMIHKLSCGWHTLYCTTIVLKFPMDAPFVVKANYSPPFFLAPLALILAPLFVISQPVYVTRDNSKSTRNRETPVSSTGIPPGTFCTYPGDPARENSVLSQDLIHQDVRIFLPAVLDRLLYCSMRLVCFASPCYARMNSKQLPSSDGILCCRKQLPAALAAFSTSLNLALALCLSSQTMSYLSHTFLTLD